MDTLRLLSRSSRLKLGADRADFQPTQPVPSAGSKADSEARIGKKRKREELDAENSTNELTESEVRQLQQQHKIKIIDVRKLSKSNKNDSRKGQKEASRLFPKPLQAFKQLKTLASNGALLENVAEQAFKEPTDVQMATIPLLLGNGEKEPDLLTVAPTGSGKTLAFMIPLITKIAKSHQYGNSGDRHVSAIILAPTKELVSQIVNEGRKLSVNTGVRIAEMRKGMRLHGQDQESNDSESSEDDPSDDSDDQELPSGTVVKSDILVSTPLSLAHALKPKASDAIKSLPAIRSLILDEADVLLDPLFREQTLAVWDACSSPELRVSLWSATIGASIEELAISKINAHHQSNGVQIATTPLIRTIIGLKDTSLPSISHRLTYASTEAGKLMGLRQLLHPTRSNAKSNSNNNQPSHETTTASDQPLRPPFLIFTQTIARAQSLYDELQYDIPVSAGGSSRIAVLHSSLSSKQRSNTMTAFRQGKIWILITTDLLSRGVDFKGINGVVNYDIPTTAASYVHRAGRTGRAGRRGGIVVTLYTRDDVKYLKPIANIISSSTSTDPTASSSPSPGGLPAWLIPSLPDLTKSSRKDLKARGVQERRAIKSSDLDNERRRKLQNRIGTRSGYEKKLADRKRDMIQGSKRRARGEARAERGSHDTDDATHARKGGGDGHGHEDGSDEFVGFGD